MLGGFFGSSNNNNNNGDGTTTARPGMGALSPLSTTSNSFTAIDMLRNQLKDQKAEEDRKKREEAERLKQEELLRGRPLGGGGGRGGDIQNSSLIGGHHQRGSGKPESNRDLHILESKKTMQGAMVLSTNQFTSFASANDMDTFSPINDEGEWVMDYDKTNDSNRACTWRSVYDSNGPMRHFIKSNNHKENENVDSGGVTSRLVSRGGMRKIIRNDGPCTVGVFLINAPVSRSPENVLYSSRITQIKEAFLRAKGKKGSRSSISLIAIISPNLTMSLEDDLFYKREDVVSTSLSAKLGPAQQAWIGVTKEQIKKSIINKCVTGEPKNGKRVVYVKPGSMLANFMESNNALILSECGERTNQALALEAWCLAAAKVYPSEVVQLLSPEALRESVIVYPIEGRYVDAAKRLAYQIIEGLPFENIEEHQFFITRLCSPKWSDPIHPDMSADELATYRSTPYMISMEIESWFSVATDMKEIQPRVVGTHPPAIGSV